MINVFLARHGETTWNAVGRYQGRQESELSPLGVAQARALAGAMRAYHLERIISSPLKRCVDTARPSAAEFKRAIEAEPLLLEIAHGTWEGRLRQDLAREDPERYRRWRNQPERVDFQDGESVADVLARWKAFVETFAPTGDTLLVTHDAVIRCALVERLRRDLSTFWQGRVLNGGYAWFTIEGGAWTLRDECAAGHLAGMIADPSTQAL